MTSYPQQIDNGYATDNNGQLKYLCDYKDMKLKKYKSSRSPSQQ